jgi:RNA polymerase sigma-70 factor (ECF subfamily)
MSNLTDRTNARSASTHDPFARALIDATSALKRYALSLYRNQTAAEDAVQETLCRAWAHRHRLAAESNLLAWMRTVLHHAFCEERKSAAAKRLQFTGEPDFADHIEAADNPERSMIVQEEFAAMAKLKPLIADILVYVGIGCTFEATSEKFGIPINSVKSYVRRGRADLMKMTGGLA